MYKFTQKHDACEMWIFGDLLKKSHAEITQDIVKSLYANLLHIKNNSTHKYILIGTFLWSRLFFNKILHFFQELDVFLHLSKYFDKCHQVKGQVNTL